MLAAFVCFVLYALAAFYSFSDDKLFYGAFSFYIRKNACCVFMLYALAMFSRLFIASFVESVITYSCNRKWRSGGFDARVTTDTNSDFKLPEDRFISFRQAYLRRTFCTLLYALFGIGHGFSGGAVRRTLILFCLSVSLLPMRKEGRDDKTVTPIRQITEKRHAEQTVRSRGVAL